VRQWEYLKIAHNQLSPRAADVDVLNDHGDEGWELIAILPNNIAYLKRALASRAAEDEAADEPGTEKPRMNGTVAAPEAPRILPAEPQRAEVRAVVKAKFRDPKTGETWSGRGRMATWLKRKQDAGEDIGVYLV